ncbi:putative trifunctional enzyme bearing the Gln amidotransferase (GATase) domain of anthranilate synthase, indole-glycerolphosphate synthase, and phosphoribosylanthranilate isomerase activities [Lyophyllum shimeji]|uniref:Multifunctional tryptophan biosynthesis protein n=1 Tax=Lyophyllum shimeji TaxID=47721 RepID=A0A9P3PT26_LYOSH|nr:putative trifunctional enzyme bearing the Gln amidotransferase (GATase) domain of anthranilate synthase, indole-glycerolphosphate synthase, and phosphoribosylanthranilate isomerase activities [Lyophyllum shimeji]
MSDAPKKQPTILETIYAQRAKDVEVAKSTAGTTPEDISALLAMHLAPPLIPLVDRLKRNPSSNTASPSPSLMAEIKRASPSKGPIAMTTNAAAQALTYALSGASVISVLTEPTWFKGSLLDMRLARQAIDALPDRPAILRKEFILDEYQIAEARLHGADTVLLIVAMLSPDRLQALYAYSLSLGMEPLVEVNNAREMNLALELGAKVIGVNNRNLHDFQVDMGTTSRLVEMVRERDVILCALSGISNPKDVQVYKEQGVRAVLVGEALMRAADTGAFIRDLLQWPEPEPERNEPTWVMVSGVKDAAEAESLAKAGADMIGFIFDDTSSRNTTPDAAAQIVDIIRASGLPASSAPTPAAAPVTPAPWFTTQRRNLQSTAVRSLAVGTFRNSTLSDILRIVAAAKLDLVQVDASVPAGWIKHIPVPVIRRFRIDDTADLARPGVHSFALVEHDTSEGDEKNFQKAATLVQAGEAGKWPTPIILSGGLTMKNVARAIQTVGPWAVEISLEADPPADNVREFMAAVKNTQ